MNFFKSKKARGSKAISVLGATLAVLLFSVSSFSQANFGRILGTVTDQSGGVISGATVTVLDTDRGVAKVLVANDAGEYNAPNLTPGTYKVRAEAKGFKAFERQNIVLEVGKEVRVDATLQPGEQTQTVTVTELLPLVETTNATLGGTINNAEINELPLNGRNYQNLVGLRPGVMIQPGGSPWSQSTNNIRPDETAWNVDGVPNSNFFDGRPVMNMPSPFTDGATILPIDAIQEFNLEENPKAEWGWKPGAVVNVGIKSGTNTLHGSAYGFYRSQAWDARNYFNPAPASDGTCQLSGPGTPADIQKAVCGKTPAQLKQFGGVVGGPVKKDKLFFFAGYEGLRSLIGNIFIAPSPATVAQGGSPSSSMVDAINALAFPTIGLATPVSPVSLALTGCTVGATAAATKCNGGLFPNLGNSNTYLSAFPNQNVSDNGIAKIDYHLSSKHTINGMFFLGNYASNGEDHPFLNAAFTDHAPIRAWTNVENWIWTPNSSLVNEVRFGYTRTTFNFVSDDVGVLADGKGYPINTGVTNPLTGGLPNINIVGFAPLGTALNRSQYYSPNPVFNFTESVSYLKGKHSLKFGVEYMHVEADAEVFVAGRGSFNFNGGVAFSGSTPLEDYYAGAPFSGQLLSGNPAIKTTWNHYAGYVQDDWRFSPKLTINLGLRYEYHSPIKEANGLLGNFDPAKGMVQQGKGGLDTIWKPYHKDFSPRLGFAWDVTGKGTTVVRGGASIIYSSFVLESFLGQFGLQNSGSTSPAAIPTGACTVAVPAGSTCTAAGGSTFGGTITLGTVTFFNGLNWDPALPGGKPGPVFPSGALSCTAAATCNVMGVDPNLHDPYITNWNLGLQHAFTTNLSLEVGYVGDHGTRLLGFRDINQPDLKTGVTPYGAKFPYLGYINWAANQSRSNYHSLQATLTQRASHGLSFTAGYTYAHGLDDGSLNRFGFLPQDSTHPEREYGSGDFDIRHRFTLTTTYNIPGIKGFGQVLEGWQINSIVNLQSPQPWPAFDGSNNFSGSGEFADRWDIFGSPDGFRSGQTSIPFCTGFGVDPVTGKATTGGATCSQQSGLLAAPTNFTPTQSTSLASKCSVVVTDPTAIANLATAGCYVSSTGVLVPPKTGSFGNMGRNIFRDSGFKNWDLSVFKNFTFKERYGAQFRVEVFNILNHPIISNPYGASNFGGIGDTLNGPGTFGCGCGTPDVIAGNNLIGSGSARVMQLGLKLKF